MSKILLSTQLKGQGRQSGNNMTKTGYLPEKAKRDRKWRSPENRKDQPGTQPQNTGKERKREKLFRQYPHIQLQNVQSHLPPGDILKSDRGCKET